MAKRKLLDSDMDEAAGEQSAPSLGAAERAAKKQAERDALRAKHNAVHGAKPAALPVKGKADENVTE